MSEVRVGISGWRYAGWRGRFYPKGLPHARELAFASRQFDAIELNGSFYSLQSPESYRAWFADVPDDFRFAVKGSRFITHMKRLKDVETPLANFFASGVLALGEKLGPMLWQFPPRQVFQRERFEKFFRLLPRDFSAAARLARGHDARVAGKRYLPRRPPPLAIRHVVEIRHESFVVPEFLDLLREHDIGLVVADTGDRYPLLTTVTSGLVYVRLHGSETLYESRYDDSALALWARRISRWRKTGKDVWVFFDNDRKVHAPGDAARLRERLGREATKRLTICGPLQ